MNLPAYPTEEEVHGYVDDELASARQAEIAFLLRQDADLAARIDGYRSDRDALRQAMTQALMAPLPSAWQARIQAATTSRPRALGRRYAIAAGLALVLGAGTTAFYAWPRRGGILEDALAARDEAAGAAARSQAGLPETARNALLQSALALHVRAPDLHHFGFQLVGLTAGGAAGRVAQLEYHDAASRRLTIYVRPSDGTVRFDLLHDGKSRVCVWQDDVVGAVIIAPISAGEMMRVASAAYADLNL